MAWLRANYREGLFYLFVFFLPWQTRWIILDAQVNGGVWEYGRISLYGWDILLILLLVISWRPLLLEAARLWSGAQGKRAALLFSALLVTYAFVAALWASGPIVAIVWAIRLKLAAVGLWLLVRVLKPKVKNVIGALAAAGTLQALWGLGQLITQKTIANKWLGVAVHPLNEGGTSVVLTAADRWLRAYGGQSHPNLLGGLLVVTALATAWLIVEGAGKGKRRIHLWQLAYAVQIAGLWATFSRGAWLALILTLIVWWARVRADRRSLHLVVAITLVVCALMSIRWWQPMVGRFAGSSRLEQQSVAERVGGFQDSQSLLSRVWWRGTGWGGYTAAVIAQQPNLPAWQYQPVHNIPMLAWLELGMVGFVLLVATLWFRLRPITLPHYLLLIPLATTALFDHYWWTMPSMLLLAWLVVALPLDEGEANPSP